MGTRPGQYHREIPVTLARPARGTAQTDPDFLAIKENSCLELS